MTVKQLINELLVHPPNALVAIEVSEYEPDPNRVLHADPRRLHFLVSGRDESDSTAGRSARPIKVAVIKASLDGRFLDTEALDDPDLAQAIRVCVIPPDPMAAPLPKRARAARRKGSGR